MRPPVLPSGNVNDGDGHLSTFPGFNEAAGFTQRKLAHARAEPRHGRPASMRPPVLPSGNCRTSATPRSAGGCFNEAAGFTQRKQ